MKHVELVFRYYWPAYTHSVGASVVLLSVVVVCNTPRCYN